MPDPTAEHDVSQTDWSMIHTAVRGGEEPARAAWEEIARRYWPAIYAYVRNSGRDVHEASDLTQGFVCDVMVARDLLAAADPERGRFRSLLLTALRNYLRERHRHATRLRRAPAGGPVARLDMQPGGGPVGTTATPEGAFNAQWGTTLVRRVLERVRRTCAEEGLERHWTVFEARVVRPLLHGARPVDYAVLVEALDLRDEAQAANLMITVKRRVGRALHEEVAGTVGDAGEIRDELIELRRALEHRP